MNELFRLFGIVAINNDEANEALDETAQKGEGTENRLSNAFKKIGAAVATYFTVTKLVEFGQKLVDLASSAETAAAKVETLLSSGTDTAAYFNDMMAASSETGVAMTDFAEAVYQAISASVDQADAVGFTTQAVQLAKAGFTETATAVDVLTTAINAYGLNADDATHLSDVLITTQNLGKTTVDELAASMGRVIPLASAYGVNIENLSAAYAELTKGGIATAESTTYLKGMFTELANEGSDVSKILQAQTGQSFSELMESGSSLGDVMEILMDSVDGDSTAFANLWSSTEAGTGALALANAGAEAFNDTLDQMINSTGATGQAYETVSNTLSNQTDILKTKVQNLGISIGTRLVPYVTLAVEWLQKVADWCMENQGTLAAIAVVIGVITTAVIAHTVAQGIQTAMNAAEVTSLGALIAAKYASAAATLAALAPYLAIAAAIAAVIAIIVLCVKHWDEIKEKVTEVAGIIKEKVTEFVDSAREKFEAFKEAAREKFEAAKEVMSNILETARSTVNDKLNNIKTAFSENGGGIRGAVAAAWEGVKGYFTLGLSFIDNLTGGKLSAIKDKFKSKLDEAKQAVHDAIEAIKKKFNFNWSLPKLKLPHITISGSFSLMPPSAPSFGIQWYAKGGVLNSPTAFGINGNQLMVGGEAGAEAVAPIDVLQGYVSEAVARQNAGMVDVLDRILNAIVTMDENMGGNMREALDGTSLSVNNREFARMVRGVI